MLIILRAGIYTTVQDLGREGFRRLGISTGGALDQPALKIANLLVGNAPEAAGLEITLGQFSAEFTRPGWIALTGAGCDAQLDGKPLWTGWRYPVKRGSGWRWERRNAACAATWRSRAASPCRKCWARAAPT